LYFCEGITSSPSHARVEEAEKLKQSQRTQASETKDESKVGEEGENETIGDEGSEHEDEGAQYSEAAESEAQAETVISEEEQAREKPCVDSEKEAEKAADRMVLHSMFSPEARRARLSETKEQR
jgi:hypothetical protein